MKVFLFFLCCCKIFAYADPELEKLWASISSMNMPTLEDYQKFETYLSKGERPYLDLLRKKMVAQNRLKLIQELKLIGPNGEEPIFEIYHGVNSKKCVLIFGSYNGVYAEKARNLFEEVLDCGFDGDVLLRIGGYPNTPNGGMKLCHIPYAFKPAFLKEAALLGYSQVLWIDTAIHPLSDLNTIFEEMEIKGHFFVGVGTLGGNNHFRETSEFLETPVALHGQIPHASSAIFGLDFRHPIAKQLLEVWLSEVEKVLSNINPFPEELCLSIVAWRNGCLPYSQFDKIVCNEREVFELFQLDQKPGLQFYLDSVR